MKSQQQQQHHHHGAVGILLLRFLSVCILLVVVTVVVVQQQQQQQQQVSFPSSSSSSRSLSSSLSSSRPRPFRGNRKNRRQLVQWHEEHHHGQPQPEQQLEEEQQEEIVHDGPKRTSRNGMPPIREGNQKVIVSTRSYYIYGDEEDEDDEEEDEDRRRREQELISTTNGTNSTTTRQQQQERELIAGGNRASGGEYPYMAQWLTGICGGTLIAKDLVLTSAHCNGNGLGAVVVGGIGYGTGVRRDVRKVVEHPQYNSVTQNYDFALIKLKGQIGNKQQAKLNLNNNLPKVTQGLKSIGFGWLDDSWKAEYADYLQEVKIWPWTNFECNEDWVYNGRILNAMICAGGRQGMCGDDGAPLVIQRAGKPDIVVGVASWDYPYCTSQSKPGVYARVTKAKNWIRNVGCKISTTNPSFCTTRRRRRTSTTTNTTSSTSSSWNDTTISTATNEEYDEYDYDEYDYEDEEDDEEDDDDDYYYDYEDEVDDDDDEDEEEEMKTTSTSSTTTTTRITREDEDEDDCVKFIVHFQPDENSPIENDFYLQNLSTGNYLWDEWDFTSLIKEDGDVITTSKMKRSICIDRMICHVFNFIDHGNDGLHKPGKLTIKYDGEELYMGRGSVESGIIAYLGEGCHEFW